MKLTTTLARRRISRLWFAGAGLCFFLTIVQTLTGGYSDQIEGAWGWLLGQILPTLTLMVGVFVTEAREGLKGPRVLDLFFFRLAFWLSAAFLATVLLTLTLQVISDRSVSDVFSLSNLWLAPLQSLTTAAVGIFFLRQPAEKLQSPKK